MADAQQFHDRMIPPDNQQNSLLTTFLNGIRLLRQEGVITFVRLSYQVLYWQVRTIPNILRFWLTKPRGAKVIKVDDVRLDSQDKPRKLIQPADTLLVKEANRLEPSAGASVDHENRVLAGIEAHNRFIAERENLLQQGHAQFAGRRVLFVLPVKAAGGGSNTVFQAVQSMRDMGVDSQIMNLKEYRRYFEKSYPNVNVPVFFATIEDIPDIAAQFDAVFATSNTSVAWIAPAIQKRPGLVTGYYIQDYEPYFYPPESKEYQEAGLSYTMIPNQVRCVTTPWIDEQIQQHHGIQCHVIGGHFDSDLFRPRPRLGDTNPNRPIRVAAMIRPTSERRSPRITMEILQQASKKYGARVEFFLFGCQPGDPGFAALPKEFPWRLAGELRPTQIANLLNESDIFVDYSVFQALGLTALESMGCGLATIVPIYGGTRTFARHEENCLVVDTHDQNASFAALQRLIEDDSLRQTLQMNAIPAAAQYYPELPAYKMLEALFTEGKLTVANQDEGHPLK